MTNKKFSRRYLLKMLAAVGGTFGLEKLFGGSAPPSMAQEMDNYVYLPIILKSGDEPRPILPGKVVHVHSEEVTYWDFGDEYYGNFVDQDTVNAIVDRGVMELTGTSSVVQAWQTLIPDYAPGKAIAIKVNFNNSFSCNESHLNIDALVQPVNAIIRGVLQAYPNFNTRDTWIYDATIGNDPPWSGRTIPQRFKDGCLYDVQFLDQNNQDCNVTAGYTSTDPTAVITWDHPSGIPAPPLMKVTDVLINATYLINVPILKRHIGTGVTLSFKNHLGSIANPALLHDWVLSSGSYYGGTSYNPLIDVLRNENILNKTVLTVGDGLFGNWDNNIYKPAPWITFGNSAPNSLLFATDSVAIDCVMCDLLHAEKAIWDMSEDYLVYASSVGLGVYERGDPWGSGYNQITYQKVEL